MENAGGIQRLRLGPRNETYVSSTGISTAEAQALIAERASVERQLEESEQARRNGHSLRWNQNKVSERQIRQVQAEKENYLQEAEQWKKQYDHHLNEEFRGRAALQEVLQQGAGLVDKRAADAKASLRARMQEARAEIQREQQEHRRLQDMQANAIPASANGAVSVAPVATDVAVAATASNASADADAARSATAAPATVPPPGGGKGKPPPPKAPGKGKSKGPPMKGGPPSAKAKFLAIPGKGKGGGLAAEAAKTRTRQANLVKLSWNLTKANTGPQKTENEFNNKLSELISSFGLTGRADRPAEGPPDDAAEAAAAAACLGVSAPAPEKQPLQETAFESVKVKELPETCLELWFKQREASKKTQQQEGSDGNSTTSQRDVLDPKSSQMLGIVLGKHAMANKGLSKREVVKSIKRGILRCDFPQELVGLLRLSLPEASVLVDKYVQEHGEAALEKLKSFELTLIIHELKKIPQCAMRFECMLFISDFDRVYSDALRKITTIGNALEVLKRKRPWLRKFFMTAHQLGQALNRDCKAPQAQRGFTLTSLEKLAATKTAKSSKFSLLHVVIALMNPTDVSQLMFSTQDMSALREAKIAKIGFTHNDIVELLNSFNGVRDFVETGSYTRRGEQPVKIAKKRQTMITAPEEADFDDDDLFAQTMETFVEDYRQQVQLIAQHCFDAYRGYEELAMFFDDMASVYPPPKTDEKKDKYDLLALLHDLAKQIAGINVEVQRDGLRGLLSAEFDCEQAEATSITPTGD